MMTKLYSNDAYRKLYDRLFECTEKGKTANLFLPTIPKDWDSLTFPRVNWYGAATNGWDSDCIPEKWSFDENLRETKDWVKIDLDKFKSGSPFWRLQEACAKLIGANSDHFIWNNLFKVGGAKDNPLASLRKQQLQMCLDIFTLENSILKPDIIVLHIGELANDFFHLSKEQEINFPGNWKQWNVSKDELSAYIVHNGQAYIWLTRSRNKRDVLVADSFLWSYKQVINGNC